jgi:hypothetical protein
LGVLPLNVKGICPRCETEGFFWDHQSECSGCGLKRDVAVDFCIRLFTAARLQAEVKSQGMKKWEAIKADRVASGIREGRLRRYRRKRHKGAQ